MKTILVPTDFSKTANHALQVAAQLAKKNNAKLVMLHMLEIPEHIMSVTQSSNDVQTHNDHNTYIPEAIFYIKLAHKRFEEIKKLGILDGLDYEEAIQNHLNFKGIIDSAHKHDADLIVMGSHGTTSFKDTFVGSHTEKVVRNSDIPVLVIKNEDTAFRVENFVFASDLNFENIESFVDAYHLSQDFDATLHLVYINTPGKEFLTSKQVDEKINLFIGAPSIEFNHLTTNIYDDISKEQGILNFSKKVNADLIGVPTHGRKGLAHFIHHSLNDDLVNHAETPVITFKIR